MDEIRQAENFQKAVDSLYVKKNTDIYITGSNAYLLSGRYVEINMLPLSFAEFRQIKDGSDKNELFAEYMKKSELPYISNLWGNSEKVDTYLEGIYSTVIVKNIEERQKRRENDPDKRKVTDIALLKNISRFLAGSIGSPISVKSIAYYVTSNGKKVSQNTVDDYVKGLIKPYILYPVKRYNVLGKQLLKKIGKCISSTSEFAGICLQGNGMTPDFLLKTQSILNCCAAVTALI